jgi:CMP-N-acetylneuraminic acid synthetase
VLALIPARGGSKSVPIKNIAAVAGAPLIAYTIAAAKAARMIDRVVVSTDSEQIAAVSRALGAEVPFLRPAELAADDTPGMAPVIHAIESLDERFDWVCLLQPTSPLRTAADIEAAWNIAIEKDALAVVSVTPAQPHPYWARGMGPAGRLTDFIKQGSPISRRQDLPPAFFLNGAIYLARRDFLLEKQTWYSDRTYGYVMPPQRSLDIDSPWDLYLAGLILKDRSSGPPTT